MDTYSTSEVAEICGVSMQSVLSAGKTLGKKIENGKRTRWTDDELGQIQLVLLKNASNAGGQKSENSIVKQNLQGSLKVGLSLQELISSGNVAAVEEFNKLALSAVQSIARNKQLEEEKKKLQLEVDKYTQWMSASQIRKEYDLPNRPGITMVAQELGLERGRDWVERFYDEKQLYAKKLYSPNAIQQIVDFYKEDMIYDSI